MERRSHIGVNPKSFKNNNRLPVKKRFNQCIAVTACHCKNNLTHSPVCVADIYIYVTKQRDIYDTVIFRFLQIFYGLTMKRKV